MDIFLKNISLKYSPAPPGVGSTSRPQAQVPPFRPEDAWPRHCAFPPCPSLKGMNAMSPSAVRNAPVPAEAAAIQS